jgi:hypothetical protein
MALQVLYSAVAPGGRGEEAKVQARVSDVSDRAAAPAAECERAAGGVRVPGAASAPAQVSARAGADEGEQVRAVRAGGPDGGLVDGAGGPAGGQAGGEAGAAVSKAHVPASSSVK